MDQGGLTKLGRAVRLGCMAPEKLTSEQMGDLREIGNVGAGNAASRLSDLLRRRCLIGFPEIVYSDLKGVKQCLGLNDSFAVTIHVGVLGDIQSRMILIMKWVYAPILVSYMRRAVAETAGGNVPLTADFVLKRLGEIMSRAFSDSVNEFLMINARVASPEMALDTGSMGLDALLDGKNLGGEHLLIHTDFSDSEKTFEGKLAYILDPASQSVVLRQLNQLRAGIAA
jgi:chemotaxis protein CheC